MEFVKVKTSQGSLGKNKGAELAPDILLEGIKSRKVGIIESNLEETNENIGRTEGDFFVGGDHSITYPLFKAFVHKNKKAGMIMFDAHPDCVNKFNPPTHEDFIRTLIDERVLAPQNLMIIGLRNIDAIESEFLGKKKIKQILMKDILDLDKLLKEIKEFTGRFDRIYLSIDIDVLDSKEAPGTGYPEEKGMSIETLLFLLKWIKVAKMPERIDLVEVNPSKDKKGITIKNAKKIISLFQK